MSFWNDLGSIFTPNRWFEHSGEKGAEKIKEGMEKFGLEAVKVLNLEGSTRNFGVEAARALDLKEALKNAGVEAAKALNLQGSAKSFGADAATILNLKKSLKNAGLSASTNLESGLRDIGLSSTKELTSLINSLTFKYAVAQSLLYLGDYILNYVKSGYLADNYVRRTEFLIEEKLFMDALETIAKAIEIDPNNPLYILKKADILFELRKFGESAIEYKQALAFANNDKILENNILLSLSSLYYNQQRYDEAILQLNKIITIANNEFSSDIYYYNIASCYEKKEDFIQAAKFFQKAIDIDSGKFEYFARLGFVKGKMGLFLEAIKEYNKALTFNPSDQKTLLYLGLSFIEVKNYNAAIIVLDKLVKINSISEYYIARGIAYLFIGNEKSAETNFWKAIELNNGSHVSYYYLGQLYTSQGENDRALKQYLKAIEYAKEQGSENEPYYIKTGESYFALGMHLEAVDMFITAINSNIHHPLYSLLNNNLLTNHKNKILVLKNSNSYDEQVNLGNLYFILGRYDEALIKYRTALKIDNSNANCHEYIGDIELQMANYKSAEKYYLQAIALNKTDNYHHKLADLYLEYTLVGENAEAYYENSINSYKEANAISQSHLHYAGLGGAYYLSGKFEEALENYKLALKFLDKKSSKFIENREQHYIASVSNIYLKLGQFDKALSIYKQLLQTNPAEHSYHAGLAETYATSKYNYPEAIKEYIEAFDYCITPAIKDFYNEKLIDLYGESGAYKEAYERIIQRMVGKKNYNNDIKNRFLKIMPQTPVYKYQSEFFAAIAAIYYEYGFYIEAAHAYVKAQENNKSEIFYYNEEAHIYVKLKNYNKAIKLYQQLEQKSVCNDSCYNNMGDAYFLSRNYSKAIQYYSKAIINNPNKVSYYNNLGIAFYKSGNFRESILIFEKLTKSDSNNAVYFNNLGISYFQRKNYHAAKKAIEQAAKIDPNQLLYQQHLNRINSIININKADKNFENTQSELIFNSDNQLEHNQLMEILFHYEPNKQTTQGTSAFVVAAVTIVPLTIGLTIGSIVFTRKPNQAYVMMSVASGTLGFVKGLKSGLVSNVIVNLLYEGIWGAIILGSTGLILGAIGGNVYVIRQRDQTFKDEAYLYFSGGNRNYARYYFDSNKFVSDFALKYLIGFSVLGYLAAIIRGTGSSVYEIITFIMDTVGSAFVGAMTGSIILTFAAQASHWSYTRPFFESDRWMVARVVNAARMIYPITDSNNIVLGHILSLSYGVAISSFFNYYSYPYTSIGKWIDGVLLFSLSDIGIGINSWSKDIYSIGYSFSGTIMGTVPCLIFGKNINDCVWFAGLNSLAMNIYLNESPLLNIIIKNESLKIITLGVTESNADIKEVDYGNNDFKLLETPNQSKDLEALQKLIGIETDEKVLDSTNQKSLKGSKMLEESSVQALEIQDVEDLEKQNPIKSSSEIEQVQNGPNPINSEPKQKNCDDMSIAEMKEQKELQEILEQGKQLQENLEKQNPIHVETESEALQVKKNSIDPELEPEQTNYDSEFTDDRQEEKPDFSIPDVNYDL